MRELAGHRPDLALRSFRAAVAARPAERSSELARDFYYLALALLRMDRPELALKSLSSAQKLRPRGVAHSAYLARSNEYGMLRRGSRDMDDFYAFFSVQACIYLDRKNSSRFDSNAEKDAVTRLIGDVWKRLQRSGKLEGQSAVRKLELFKAQAIAFPMFGFGRPARGRILTVDFGCGCVEPQPRPPRPQN